MTFCLRGHSAFENLAITGEFRRAALNARFLLHAWLVDSTAVHASAPEIRPRIRDWGIAIGSPYRAISQMLRRRRHEGGHGSAARRWARPSSIARPWEARESTPRSARAVGFGDAARPTA